MISSIGGDTLPRIERTTFGTGSREESRETLSSRSMIRGSLWIPAQLVRDSLRRHCIKSRRRSGESVFGESRSSVKGGATKVCVCCTQLGESEQRGLCEQERLPNHTRPEKRSQVRRSTGGCPTSLASRIGVGHLSPRAHIPTQAVDVSRIGYRSQVRVHRVIPDYSG